MSQKGFCLLKMFMSIYNCKCKSLQGGTLCGPVFCKFLNRFLKRKQLFWKLFFWICKGLLCLCLWKAFKYNSKQFNTIQQPLKVKESNCFEERTIFDSVKACVFFCVFEKHSITIQNRSTTIQKVITSFELVFRINTKSQLAPL